MVCRSVCPRNSTRGGKTLSPAADSACAATGRRATTARDQYRAYIFRIALRLDGGVHVGWVECTRETHRCCLRLVGGSSVLTRPTLQARSFPLRSHAAFRVDAQLAGAAELPHRLAVLDHRQVQHDALV